MCGSERQLCRDVAAMLGGTERAALTDGHGGELADVTEYLAGVCDMAVAVAGLAELPSDDAGALVKALVLWHCRMGGDGDE
ncbi:MAG: hypothetical protein ACI38Z_04620 [Parafannyhessea sp.]|uniref:hypothetical protein n=1 Tax=Parafannyhessea sp. TaxID=2847324 RepID=UPI003F005791